MSRNMNANNACICGTRRLALTAQHRDNCPVLLAKDDTLDRFEGVREHPDNRPATGRCPIGAYSAHTLNYERDECIWCGPNGLAWKPGHWVDIGDGLSAWSVDLAAVRAVAAPTKEETR